MKVIHFQRRPVSDRYFSIENYFESVRHWLPSYQVTTSILVCRYISQGLFKRIYNTLEAAFQKADIYHVTGDVHYITLLLPRNKTILTIHDCVFMKHPSSVARKILKMFWLTLPSKRASYITCVSEKTKHEVLQYISFDPNRILVIPTVVNDQLYEFKERPFNATCPRVLLIGTTPNKNIERVAQALEGVTCKVEIIGLLSNEQKNVLELHKIDYTNETSLSNDQVSEKYKESDILLFASVYEGFGMPILEAQLTGRPVITSFLSPMKEVAGDAACLVDPFEPESIKEGLLKVLSSETYRKELVQKGLLNTKRFSSKAIAKQYADLYTLCYQEAKD